MKKSFLFFSFSIFFSLSVYSQCNVQIDTKDDVFTYYTMFESVYENPNYDYSRGVTMASIRLQVLQLRADMEMLKFHMYVITGNSGSQPLVVPRTMKIVFSDNSTLNLVADNILNTRQQSGVSLHTCQYILNMNDFLSIQQKSINRITITDNRNNNSMNCQPYSNILKEQANCIATRLKK